MSCPASLTLAAFRVFRGDLRDAYTRRRGERSLQ
jgi:hypothetical protein